MRNQHTLYRVEIKPELRLPLWRARMQTSLACLCFEWGPHHPSPASSRCRRRPEGCPSLQGQDDGVLWAVPSPVLCSERPGDSFLVFQSRVKLPSLNPSGTRGPRRTRGPTQQQHPLPPRCSRRARGAEPAWQEEPGILRAKASALPGSCICFSAPAVRQGLSQAWHPEVNWPRSPT